MVPAPAIGDVMQVDIKATRVIIGNVSNGFISAEYTQSLLSLSLRDREAGWNFWGGILWGRSGVNITQKRNELMCQFLKTDGEWLLLIDSDMVFPNDLIPKLLHAAAQADTKVIGGLCLVIDETIGPYPTLFHVDEREDKYLAAQIDYPEGVLLQVAATGAACLLIHRDAVEAIRNVNIENRRWLFDHKDEPLLKEMQVRNLINVPTENHGWFSEHPVVNDIKLDDDRIVSKESWVGEDIDLCLKLGSLGYSIFVDCGLEIGHHKEDRIWWPRDIKDGMGFRRPKIVTAIPIKDKLEMTSNLVEQIRRDKCDEIIICDNGSGEETKAWLEKQDDITVIDCPDIGINAMWNRAADYAMKKHGNKTHIAFLNNDLILGDGFLDKLSMALFKNREMIAVSGNYDNRVFHSDIQEVNDICANRYDGTGGLAGFAFMVRGEWFASGYRFPEECMWWYGDNDLMVAIQIADVVTKDIPRKAGIVIGAAVEHLDGGGQTSGDPLWTEFDEQLEKDRIAYEEIYNKQMESLRVSQAAMNPPTHECELVAVGGPNLDTVQGIINDPRVDRLPFVADLEESVKSFTRQWSDDVPDMVKIHEDLERYEKIIAETQPEIVIECGTWTGGSAEWLASLGLEVVTIDIEDHVSPERKSKLGESVHWLIGSSVDDEIVEHVEELVGSKRCMVILDSDHHACHVFREMNRYSHLVTPGCYMIVEDGIMRYIPVPEHETMIHHGSMDAIEAFMHRYNDFERDEQIERLHPVTLFPAGFLRSI